MILLVLFLLLSPLYSQDQIPERGHAALQLRIDTPLLEKIDFIERSFIEQLGTNNPLLSTTWPIRIAIDIANSLHSDTHKIRVELHIEALQVQLELFDAWATLYISHLQEHEPADETVKQMIEVAAKLDAYIKEYLEEYIQSSRFYQEGLQKNGTRELATLLLLPGLLSKGFSLIAGLTIAFFGWRMFGTAPNHEKEVAIEDVENQYFDALAKLEESVRDAAGASNGSRYPFVNKDSALKRLNAYAGSNHYPPNDMFGTRRKIQRWINAGTRRVAVGLRKLFRQ